MKKPPPAGATHQESSTTSAAVFLPIGAAITATSSSTGDPAFLGQRNPI